MKFCYEIKATSSKIRPSCVCAFRFRLRSFHVSSVVLSVLLSCISRLSEVSVLAFSPSRISISASGWRNVISIHQSNTLFSQPMLHSDASLGKNGTNLFAPDVTIASYESEAPNRLNKSQNSEEKVSITSMVSCALLLTGNTVGASMMVLPQTASMIGMHSTVGLIGAMYVLNLLSGLTISEVAIKQYEMGCEPPTSFKDFASLLIGENVGRAVAALFIFINWCVVAFGTTRFGEVIHEQTKLSTDTATLSAMFCALLSTLIISLPPERISKISAVCTSLLFLSLGGILIAGLSSMQDPLITLGIPPSSGESTISTLGTAAPVFLTAMIYQNIVPTVVKLLSYDRFSTVAVITVGSTIPIMMYLAYIFATLGGGIDQSTVDPKIVSIFATVSLTGGCIAAILSLAEEFTSVIRDLTGNEANECDVNYDNDKSSAVSNNSKDNSGASVASVLLAAVPPLVVGALYSRGSTFVDALKWAGTYGSPMVYGILPPILAYLQRQDEKKNGYLSNNIVPGGTVTMFGLAFTSISFAISCSLSGYFHELVK